MALLVGRAVIRGVSRAARPRILRRARIRRARFVKTLPRLRVLKRLRVAPTLDANRPRRRAATISLIAHAAFYAVVLIWARAHIDPPARFPGHAVELVLLPTGEGVAAADAPGRAASTGMDASHDAPDRVASGQHSDDAPREIDNVAVSDPIAAPSDPQPVAAATPAPEPVARIEAPHPAPAEATAEADQPAPVATATAAMRAPVEPLDDPQPGRDADADQPAAIVLGSVEPVGTAEPIDRPMPPAMETVAYEAAAPVPGTPQVEAAAPSEADIPTHRAAPAVEDPIAPPIMADPIPATDTPPTSPVAAHPGIAIQAAAESEAGPVMGPEMPIGDSHQALDAPQVPAPTTAALAAPASDGETVAPLVPEISSSQAAVLVGPAPVAPIQVAAAVGEPRVEPRASIDTSGDPRGTAAEPDARAVLATEPRATPDLPTPVPPPQARAEPAPPTPAIAHAPRPRPPQYMPPPANAPTPPAQRRPAPNNAAGARVAAPGVLSCRGAVMRDGGAAAPAMRVVALPLPAPDASQIEARLSAEWQRQRARRGVGDEAPRVLLELELNLGPDGRVVHACVVNADATMIQIPASRPWIESLIAATTSSGAFSTTVEWPSSYTQSGDGVVPVILWRFWMVAE